MQQGVLKKRFLSTPWRADCRANQCGVVFGSLSRFHVPGGFGHPLPMTHDLTISIIL